MSPKKPKPSLWARFKKEPITSVLGIIVCVFATLFLYEVKPILLTASAERLAIILGVIVFVYAIGVVLMLSPDLFIKKFWNKDTSTPNPFKDRPSA